MVCVDRGRADAGTCVLGLARTMGIAPRNLRIDLFVAAQQGPQALFGADGTTSIESLPCHVGSSVPSAQGLDPGGLLPVQLQFLLFQVISNSHDAPGQPGSALCVASPGAVPSGFCPLERV